ncbi:MAG: IclR family transcriptional regulator, partial [Deltaproteobacteria bacterium]|nr:IclR family transcriptional regulator [Deltaproteobacteria bacterium]
LLILTGRYLSNLDIVRVARPIIRGLVAEINEDTELAVMKGSEIIFLHKEECSKPLKYSIEIGERAPAYATACGKAILANLSEDEISEYFSSMTLSSFTDNTVTDLDLLRRELQDVRSRGLAYVCEEFQHGISAIAAPIFNFCGNVVGSITVTVPSIRFNSEHNRFIETRLLRAAANISQQLGFDPDSQDGGTNLSKKSPKGVCQGKES